MCKVANYKNGLILLVIFHLSISEHISGILHSPSEGVQSAKSGDCAILLSKKWDFGQKVCKKRGCAKIGSAKSGVRLYITYEDITVGNPPSLAISM